MSLYEGLLNNLATSSDFPRKKKVATAISSFIMHFRCCYIFLLPLVGKGGVHLPSIFEQGREEAGRGGTGSTTTIALLFERPRLGGMGLANYYNSFSTIQSYQITQKKPLKTMKICTKPVQSLIRAIPNPRSPPFLLHGRGRYCFLMARGQSGGEKNISPLSPPRPENIPGLRGGEVICVMPLPPPLSLLRPLGGRRCRD